MGEVGIGGRRIMMIRANGLEPITATVERRTSGRYLIFPFWGFLSSLIYLIIAVR